MNSKVAKTLLSAGLALAFGLAGCSKPAPTGADAVATAPNQAVNGESPGTAVGGSAASTPADPLPVASGVTLGSGWYPTEQFNGKTFRWVNNDAELTVCPSGRTHVMTLSIEPGPGVNSKPFTLRVSGNHGDGLTTSVHGLQNLAIPIRKAGVAETFLLHAASKNHPTPNETRILNFRIFNVALESAG
ncbi:MAG: hypothetical protein M3N19_05230, partial [Candidatus Eremiobacteraeota bacterium]|nr:hypothetical protein [Candidatus Eremiobacteraeota bacterium]